MPDDTALLDLVIDQALFFATCLDADVQPDVAVNQLESIVAAVLGLPQDQRAALVERIGHRRAIETHPDVARGLDELLDSVTDD